MNKQMGGIVSDTIEFLPHSCTLYYYGKLDFDLDNIHIEPMSDKEKERITEIVIKELKRFNP